MQCNGVNYFPRECSRTARVSKIPVYYGIAKYREVTYITKRKQTWELGLFIMIGDIASNVREGIQIIRNVKDVSFSILFFIQVNF
jgi:hypothetical protein